MYILEHTGMYSPQISVFFTENTIPFTLVSGLEVKRSLVIARGKGDKLDVVKIALFGYRLREELKPYIMPKDIVLSIKRLEGLRERMVKQRSGYRCRLKEIKIYLV